MAWLIVGMLIGVILLVVSGMLFKTQNTAPNDKILGAMLLIFGVFSFSLLIFLGAPEELPTGTPKMKIYPGEYKVGFIYVAGDNVNLGLELKQGAKEAETERLYFYQFPVSAFDGSRVEPNGKKLIVVESNGFKKLKLE